MVRKIKSKKNKPETGTLDMNNLKDISPVITYWLNLLGEEKETHDCFKDCKKKDQVLMKISEMIMDEHGFIDRLINFRKLMIKALGGIDNNKTFKDDDVLKRAEEIESSINSHTAIGYWETMKLMQFFIINSYIDSGREKELPEYGKGYTNFKPKEIKI